MKLSESQEKGETLSQNSQNLEKTNEKYKEIIQMDVPERIYKNLGSRLKLEENELCEESNWIYGSLSENDRKKFSTDDISKFLELYRKDHYDIPYIYTYLKEMYNSNIFSQEILWEIIRLDEEFPAFYQEKKTLIAKISSYNSQIGGKYQYLLNHLSKIYSTLEMLDFKAFINFSDSLISTQISELSEKQQEIAKFKISKIDEFVNYFSLSDEDFYENLKNSIKIKKLPENSVLAHILAKNYINSIRLNDEKSVFIEGIKYLAYKITACQPILWSKIREQFLKFGELTTCPSPKGDEELNIFHNSYRIKRIIKRPINSLNDDIFLEIIQKEKDGLIISNISLEKDILNNLIEWAQHLFSYSKEEILLLDEPSRQKINSYNEILHPAVEMCIKQHILPEIEKQIRAILEQRASQYIQNQIFKELKKICMAQPMKKADSSGFKNMGGDCILSIVVQNDNNGTKKKSVQIALLDEYGELIEQKIFLNLAFSEEMNEYDKKLFDMDLEILKTVIRLKFPKLIAVLANCKESYKIFQTLSSENFLSEAYNSIDSKSVLVKLILHPFPAFLDIPPQINSAENSYSLNLRLAVSLGRYAQNPISEIINIYENTKFATGEKIDVIMSFHPLQSLIESKKVIKIIEQVICDCINEIGLDFTKIVEHKYLKSSLKYICGLGKHTANFIFSDASFKPKQRIDFRKILPEFIYTNFCPFIKFFSPDFSDPQYEILDSTRIHPKNYSDVKKCALEALKKRGVNENEIKNAIFESLQQGFGTFNPIEQYLNSDEQNLNPILIKQKDFILNELKNPYKIILEICDIEKINEKIIFAINEIPQDYFFEGKIISANISKLESSNFYCKIQLFSKWLEAKLIVSDDPNEFPMSLKENSEIIGRIIKINVKIPENKVEITVSIKEQDLKSHEKWVKLNEIDKKYFYLSPNDLKVKETKKSEILPSPETKIEKPIENPTQKIGKYIPRNIKHDKFLNVSLNKVVQILNTMDVGEFYFRPSSFGNDHLTLTLKFYTDVYVHIDIKEEKKDSDSAIGSKLIISDDCFKNLDDIIENYIAKVMTRVKDLTKYAKFIHKPDLEFLRGFVQENHNRNPKIISYGFGIVPAYPQYVVLIICPKPGCMFEEYIKVKPKGLYFHDKYYNTIEDLVDYFKNNFNKPEYHRYLKKRNRPPVLLSEPPEKQEMKIDIPENPMQTSYLPNTEYQQQFESVTMGEQSVYAEQGQFSTYVAPQAPNMNPTNPIYSKVEISGKRDAPEHGWGDSGFKEPDRPSFARRGGNSRGRFMENRGSDNSGWGSENSDNAWGKSSIEQKKSPPHEQYKGFNTVDQNKSQETKENDTWGNSKSVSDEWGVTSGNKDDWGKPSNNDWGSKTSESNDWGTSNFDRPRGNRGDDRPRGFGRGRGDRGGRRGGRACFNCGEEGHMSKDCPKPSTRGSRGGRCTCFNCGESGHMSRECTKPRRGGFRGRGRGSSNSSDLGGWGNTSNTGWGNSPNSAQSSTNNAWGTTSSNEWGTPAAAEDKKKEDTNNNEWVIDTKPVNPTPAVEQPGKVADDWGTVANSEPKKAENVQPEISTTDDKKEKNEKSDATSEWEKIAQQTNVPEATQKPSDSSQKASEPIPKQAEEHPKETTNDSGW